MEDGISHSITIKKNATATRVEADEALEEQPRYTLGKAVHLADREGLFPARLQNQLKDFYHRRNWLIHQSMLEYLTARTQNKETITMTKKIKAIANDVEVSMLAIERDMIKYFESNGRDMSKVHAALEENDKRK